MKTTLGFFAAVLLTMSARYALANGESNSSLQSKLTEDTPMEFQMSGFSCSIKR